MVVEGRKEGRKRRNGMKEWKLGMKDSGRKEEMVVEGREEGRVVEVRNEG